MRAVSRRTLAPLRPSSNACIAADAGLGKVLIVASRFDSSIGRGDFVTPIGVGRVIKGMYTQSFKRASPELSTGRSAPVRRASKAPITNATPIPVGWEEGVTQMKVGEKAILDISR